MKLQDFKVVYICPDHNEKYHNRKLHMDKLLADMGFKDIVHFKSGNEKYPKCLSLATIDVLTKYMDEPFILLEDDIENTTHFDCDFDFRPEADAIYLGISIAAGHDTLNTNVFYSKFEPYSSTQVRVLNMLSAHAILYISQKYKHAVIDIIKTNLGVLTNDVAMSRIQKEHLVLANMKPIFYQSNKFNATGEGIWDVEKTTRIHIKYEPKLILGDPQ
jgi:hypothetical protein